MCKALRGHLELVSLAGRLQGVLIGVLLGSAGYESTKAYARLATALDY